MKIKYGTVENKKITVTLLGTVKIVNNIKTIRPRRFMNNTISRVAV